MAIIINSSQTAVSRKIFLYRNSSIKGTIAHFSDTLKSGHNNLLAAAAPLRFIGPVSAGEWLRKTANIKYKTNSTAVYYSGSSGPVGAQSFVF